MKFIVSDAAKRSFPSDGAGCKPAVLIAACTKKIRHYYALTDDGKLFFSGPGGVEKLDKLECALEWLKNNPEVWAPVIDVRSPRAERFFFADGRHTFVALEQLGYSCIHIAVPEDRANDLLAVLQCDHT
jgi:hypothetical protein